MQRFQCVLFSVLTIFAIGVASSPFNDRIIDFVLRVARERSAQSGKIREVKLPGNISMSLVVIDEMRMSNLLNLYRIVNDSHLRLSEEGFGMRTGLEIRNVSMRGRYEFNQWPLRSTGEIESSIGKLSIAADITLDRFNFQKINLNSLKCLNIEDVKLKKMTNAYEIVRSTISSALNSWLGRSYLKSAIETSGKEFMRTGLDLRKRID